MGLKPRPRFVRFSGKRGHKSDVGQVKNGRWRAAGLILGEGAAPWELPGTEQKEGQSP